MGVCGASRTNAGGSADGVIEGAAWESVAEQDFCMCVCVCACVLHLTLASCAQGEPSSDGVIDKAA